MRTVRFLSPLQIEPMQRKLKLKAHKRYALKCKFSPDCTLLATTSADQTAKIWRTADLLPLSERLENETNGGSVLNSNWPLAENLSPLALLTTMNQKWVWDVAFSNDSQYVITGTICDLFWFKAGSK
jgi:G protein beta subunit-like protein